MSLAIAAMADSSVDPDAQATTTDFLDFTEHLPADVIRSLALIRKLDATYLTNTQSVHHLTKLYATIPTLPSASRPNPLTLRQRISYHLDRALDARENALAEANRVYDVVFRSRNRLSSIVSKLQSLPKPPSRDPTPEPVTTSPQVRKSRSGRNLDNATTKRLTLNPPRVPSLTLGLKRKKHYIVPGEPLPSAFDPDSPIASTEHPDVDSNVSPRQSLEPPLKKLKLMGNEADKTMRSGTRQVVYPYASVEGLSVQQTQANRKRREKETPAQRLEREDREAREKERKRLEEIERRIDYVTDYTRLVPQPPAGFAIPPPGTAKGSEELPWTRLTSLDRWRIRKKFKKSDTWLISETVEQSFLNVEGRGQDVMEATKARAEETGEPFIDCDAHLRPVAQPTESHDTQVATGTIEVKSYKKGKKSNDIKGSKKGQGERQQPVELSRSAAEDLQKMASGLNLFRSLLTFASPTSSPAATPQAQTTKESTRKTPSKKKAPSDALSQSPAASIAPALKKPKLEQRPSTLTPSASITAISKFPDHSPPATQEPKALSAVSSASPQAPDTMALLNESETQALEQRTRILAEADERAAKRAEVKQARAEKAQTEEVEAEQAENKAIEAKALGVETIGAELTPTSRFSSRQTSTRPPSRRSFAASVEPALITSVRNLRRNSTPGSNLRKTPKPAASPKTETTAAGRRSKRPQGAVAQSTEDGAAVIKTGRRMGKPEAKPKVQTEDTATQPWVRTDVDGRKEVITDDEPRYCICDDVSYGDMIACDHGQDGCPEWFHMSCVELHDMPGRTVKWYCPFCRVKLGKGVDTNGLVGRGIKA